MRNWLQGSQVSKARPGAPFDYFLDCSFVVEGGQTRAVVRGSLLEPGSFGYSMGPALRGMQPAFQNDCDSINDAREVYKATRLGNCRNRAVVGDVIAGAGNPERGAGSLVV